MRKKGETKIAFSLLTAAFFCVALAVATSAALVEDYQLCDMTCSQGLTSAFQTTARLDPSHWEQAIWVPNSNVTSPTIEYADRAWGSDDYAVKSFNITYRPQTGTITHIIDGEEITSSMETYRKFTHIWIIAHGNTGYGSGANISDYQFEINGESIPVWVVAPNATEDLVGFLITLNDSDSEQQNGFTLTGTFGLAKGSSGEQEIPSLHVYPMNATPLEGCIDDDNDGVCDDVDLCLDTVIPEERVPVDHLYPEGPANELWLKPNHFAVTRETFNPTYFQTNTGSASSPVIVNSDYTMVDTYGCSCEQILECKPGNNKGEYKWGCSAGTMRVWTSQEGWATACQVNGVVTTSGETKPILEDTDNDFVIDPLDNDNDDDGIPDDEDSEPESPPQNPGEPGNGIPLWWCDLHPEKC
jgi:hypothetical protein